MSDQPPQQPQISEEEKKKKREEEKKRKQEAKLKKEQEKQERLKKQQEEQLKKLEMRVTWEEIFEGKALFGTYPLIQSTQQSPFTYTQLEDVSAHKDQEVTVRSRVHVVRGTGKVAFIVLRQGSTFVQAVFTQTAEHPDGMAKFITKLSRESVVDITAKVTSVAEPIEAATIKDIELQVSKIFVISRAAVLPIQVEDCMKGSQHDEEELEKIEQSNEAKSDLPKGIGQENRLNYRVIDMRAPAQLSVFKIQSAVGRFFREFLYTQGFHEIHTPKFIGAASEGGSEVFEVKYFSGKAYLAQSPQLYKQMAVVGDLMRVFEIGPVFRAENSHTHRHLTEFVGLDLEMAIQHHYSEVLDVIDQMFIYIFESIEKHYKRELETIATQYPFEPIAYNKTRNLRIAYPEAISMLREDGIEIGDFDDINTAKEIRLGKLVKDKYGTDFYFLERFPMNARPFYTMPCPDDERYSNSYDIFLRGEEISSGAQRIHDPSLLLEKAKLKGVDMGPLKAYVESFSYGSFPHAGCGIGLERIVMLYLGIGNVRKTTIWPRDPNRLTP